MWHNSDNTKFHPSIFDGKYLIISIDTIIDIYTDEIKFSLYMSQIRSMLLFKYDQRPYC